MSYVDVAGIRNTRAIDPDAVVEAARERRRRPLADRLLLLAADHPARGIVAVGGREMAMSDRGELLGRLVDALQNPLVDGVVGTADILEDLLLLGSLHDKVVLGSMNRSGLAGAEFEVDDRFTGYDAATIDAMGFNGGKMLVRFATTDPRTADVMEAAAHAVGDLADRNLMALIEPFMADSAGGSLRHDVSTDAVIKSVGIAGGLGKTSRRTWLKVPVVPDMERVCRATTLPLLILGGDPSGPAEETYADWQEALSLPGVSGMVVGRTLLYPDDDDVAAAVSIAAKLVHGG